MTKFSTRYKISIDKKRFFVGIAIGLSFALFVFLFLTYSYVLSSAMSSSMERRVYDFPEKLFNFYSLFVASLSVSIGFAETLRYWFHKPRLIWSTRRIRLNEVFSDQRYLHYGTLSLFLRSMLFVLLMTYFLMSEDIVAIHRTFSYGYFLIPLVLFLSSWLNLVKVYKRSAQKWMLVSFGICALVSIGFTQLNRTIPKKLIETTKKYDPVANLEITLPTSHSWSSYPRWSYRIEGISLKLDNRGNIMYFIGMNRVIPEAVTAHIRSRLETIFELERQRAYVTLNADKNIPMQEIDAFKSRLLNHGIKYIAYSINPLDNNEMPKTSYRLLYKERIHQSLGEEPYENTNWLGFITKVRLDAEERILVNESEQSVSALISILLDVKRKQPKGLVEFEYSNTSTLGDYVMATSAHKKVFKHLLNEHARLKYKEEYDYLDREQKAELRKIFPFYFSTKRIN